MLEPIKIKGGEPVEQIHQDEQVEKVENVQQDEKNELIKIKGSSEIAQPVEITQNKIIDIGQPVKISQPKQNVFKITIVFSTSVLMICMIVIIILNLLSQMQPVKIIKQPDIFKIPRIHREHHVKHSEKHAKPKQKKVFSDNFDFGM